MSRRASTCESCSPRVAYYTLPLNFQRSLSLSTTTQYSDNSHEMTDLFVKTFTHLKDRKSADQALATLPRVASLVKPIMRKHGWVLPVLAEFFPDNPNLLGEQLPSNL